MTKNPEMSSSLKFLLSFFVSHLLFTSTLCRRPPPQTTAVLDVTSSLKQAQHVLSFNPQSFKHLTNTAQNQNKPHSGSVFSIPLHTRSSIHKTNHADYKALVLSRLHRDSDRVDSLTARLKTEKFSTPVISGINLGSGEYFSRVGVGSPAKQFYMVLDSGSDINWIQCEPCRNCYQQSDPIFNPIASSTYNPVSCASSQCTSLDGSTCRNGRCLYQVGYGDGSYTVGEFVTETMSFGDSGNVDDVALGCGHENQGLFNAAAGLLGLGGGPLSLTSQIKATSFSYCLVDRDSSNSSTLDFNSELPADSVIAPLIRNPRLDTFYYVGLTGFDVGGQPVELSSGLFDMDESGNGGVIIDCGTAVTRLQTQAYNALRDAFVRLTRDLTTTDGVELFDTCYDFSSMDMVRVPTVSFRFSSGILLDLPASNYLVPVDSTGTFCLAFAPTSSSLSIIGNVQQQGIRVNFDLANNNVGFVPQQC